ncbi:HAD family hydrolase [Tuwongella immobilis]|uniref:HAD family hydrolase n=1 Tax=Tuwongella immobilis TaxID=692036 RepID=A0A6C2YNP6_9BACT|nr:HAD family hydrolase [Tuwongella immobilis]VIP03014.1 had-superfamily hydrolase : Haloacid dehalogenase superfamily enzyme, subfamily IA OS=Singulisphaera acidiphila (strain ATCC BAA-1392 / DSM 18658 / VKM B-2454 / MOB10) GN=Sinac_5298 PE=4 SV=1: HAD_2 [Tuwongella immobilis]VTS03129.1 had-superfamily hydrolase : Haloacid dehalogenase superfamily enzyme, subfamily IA OS=Singulisphaera acidiphila (strain ATCC BAA-1392 / DSM 18658 / VKM B-2454 / MOB10) GN=Sinac_5298 PE=4 SV=1: HAD_2 [Tuwongella i
MPNSPSSVQGVPENSPAWNEIRAVVFDAVATVIFPNPSITEVYGDVAERHGGSRKPVPQLQAAFRHAYAIQEQIDQAAQWQTSEERERQRWWEIVSHSLDDVADPQAAFADLFGHYSRGAAWRVPDGTAELLERLHQRGFRLAMASNYDSRLQRVMSELPELARLRDNLIISSLVGWRKPAIGFFEAVQQRLQIPAHQILFVGDDLQNDVLGAQAAGFQAVWLQPKGDPNGQVQTIRQLAELEPILSGSDPLGMQILQ